MDKFQDYVVKAGDTQKSIAGSVYGNENLYGLLQNNGVTTLTPGSTIKIPIAPGQAPANQPVPVAPMVANAGTPNTIGGNTPAIPLSTSATNIPVPNQEAAAVSGVQAANIPTPMGKDQQMQGGQQAFDLLDRLKSGQVSVNQTPTTQAEKEAFLMYQNYNKFKDADAKTLLTAIQNGELTPDPNNVLWRAISPDGKATPAMAQAFAMWEQQSSTGYTGNRNGDPYLGGQFPGKVDSTDQANAILNRDEAITGEVVDQMPDTLKKWEDTLNQAMSIKAPDAPNYQQTLADLRKDFSVTTLESDVNSLNTQLADLEAQKRQRIQANVDQPVAMGVIAGRVSEVERQENERIDAINRQINSKVAQMNTANNTIQTMMQAKQLDYGIAKDQYETQMSTAVSMMKSFETMRGQELDYAQAENKRVQDNARANLQTYYNAITDGKMDTTKITMQEALQIRNMELQAGMPAGTFLNLRNTNPTSEVKTQVARVESDGKKYFDIVMQDKYTGEVSIQSIYAGIDKEAALNMAVDQSTIDKNNADALMSPLDREYKQAQINKTNLENAADYNIEGGGLSVKPTISGAFGVQYGKGVEATKNGKNIGVDFAVPVGTSVAVPPGEWKVEKTQTGVQGGNITDYKSTPYGNSILLTNTSTGEKVRLSHLSEVKVSDGQILSGGTVAGLSGATGNVTGPHLDVEYYAKGSSSPSDVMATDYGKYYASGGTVKKNAASTATAKKDDVVKMFKDSVKQDNLLGSDGKMSPDDYNAMKTAWQGEGYTPSEFDNIFGQYINTKEAGKYQIGSTADALKKTEDQQKQQAKLRKAALDAVLNALPQY